MIDKIYREIKNAAIRLKRKGWKPADDYDSRFISPYTYIDYELNDALRIENLRTIKRY